MSSGYIGVNLKEMIEQIGENRTKEILSDFSCPLNPDVEHFLQQLLLNFRSRVLQVHILLWHHIKTNMC